MKTRYFGLLALLFILSFGLYYIGKICAPQEVDLFEWQSFVLISILFLWVVSWSLFGFYKFYYYKSVKLKNYIDIFKLRRPWIFCMWLVFFFQVVFSFLIGLATIQENQFSILVRCLLFCIFEGIIGMFFYWIISFYLPLPKMVKYIPFLSLKRAKK